MASTGIRELKNKLSEYVKRAEAGERVAITVHGRVVAELGPPRAEPAAPPLSRIDQMIAEGLVRPPLKPGPHTWRWPDINLPPGTAQQLIDEDRDER